MRTLQYLFIAILLLPSLSMAEPYAKWGMLADGTPIPELDTKVAMPEASDVPIPLAPGGVFIADGGSNHCTIAIRSKVSVEKICQFYKSALDSSEFIQVEELKIYGESSCALYRNGEIANGTGVLVYEDLDPLFAINGTTLMHVTYPPPDGKPCDYRDS